MTEKQIPLPRPVPIPARAWDDARAYVEDIREDWRRLTAEYGGETPSDDDLAASFGFRMAL